jgi:hypothetical protein
MDLVIMHPSGYSEENVGRFNRTGNVPLTLKRTRTTDKEIINAK